MATRMQQRRGTAAQWISTNSGNGPVLNSGEIGYESDTNKFKIGDGVNHWLSLPYFVDLNTTIAGAPNLLNSLDEIAAAIGDDPAFFTTVATNLTNHQNDTTAIHGIADTSLLVTTTGTQTLTNKTITTPAGLVKGDVGLGNVDNSSDANKPVSTAQQTALDLKAPLASPTFTGTVSGVTATHVGLGNVDNTSDANKPISTNTQTALDLKAPKASPTFTGTVTTGHVLPATDITYDLGSPSKMWRDIYVGPGSLYVNGQKVLQTESGDVVLTADANENLVVRTSGDGNIELDPTGSGSVTIKAPLVIQAGNSISNSDGNAVNFSGAIKADTVSSKTANTDLSLSADGTGKVYLNDNAEVAGNLVIAGNLTVSGTTTTVNSETISLADNIIDLNSNFTTGTPTENAGIKIKRGDSADVQIRWNEADDKWEFTNNGTNYSVIPPTDNPTFTGTVSGVTKSHVGLGNVDNTSDANKPISTATQTALDLKETVANVALKAPLASPTFTGTVSGITKAMVGLSNVDNSADIDKDISTLTQAALNLKAPLASPTFTGTVTLPAGTVTSGVILDGTVVNADINASAAIDWTKLAISSTVDSTEIGYVNGVTSAIQTQLDAKLASADAASTYQQKVVDVSDTEISYLNGVTGGIQGQIDLKAPINNPTFTGTVGGVTKSMVGLANVDNTADTAKPVSTAQATAIGTAKTEAIADAATAAGTAISNAVAALTKSSVGLGNVDNTSDANKPVSTAQATAIATAKSEVKEEILGAGVPAALNTLDELAAALGDDANFAATVTTSLGLKAPLASPTFTGTVTVAAAGVAFTDGTQTKEGTPSRKTISQKTANYTLAALTERDSMIEMNSASATTLTVPANVTIAYPIGTSIDVLRVGAGAVDVAAASGVTINATPGLKLRAQWSSATLLKRATDTWVLIGDLTA